MLDLRIHCVVNLFTVVKCIACTYVTNLNLSVVLIVYIIKLDTSLTPLPYHIT